MDNMPEVLRFGDLRSKLFSRRSGNITEKFPSGLLVKISEHCDWMITEMWTLMRLEFLDERKVCMVFLFGGCGIMEVYIFSGIFIRIAQIFFLLFFFIGFN